MTAVGGQWLDLLEAFLDVLVTSRWERTAGRRRVRRIARISASQFHVEGF